MQLGASTASTAASRDSAASWAASPGGQFSDPASPSAPFPVTRPGVRPTVPTSRPGPDVAWARSRLEPFLWYNTRSSGTALGSWTREDEGRLLNDLHIPSSSAPSPTDPVRVYCYPHDKSARELARCSSPQCEAWRGHRLVGTPYLCADVPYETAFLESPLGSPTDLYPEAYVDGQVAKGPFEERLMPLPDGSPYATLLAELPTEPDLLAFEKDVRQRSNSGRLSYCQANARARALGAAYGAYSFEGCGRPRERERVRVRDSAVCRRPRWDPRSTGVAAPWPGRYPGPGGLPGPQPDSSVFPPPFLQPHRRRRRAYPRSVPPGILPSQGTFGSYGPLPGQVSPETTWLPKDSPFLPGRQVALPTSPQLPHAFVSPNVPLVSPQSPGFTPFPSLPGLAPSIPPPQAPIGGVPAESNPWWPWLAASLLQTLPALVPSLSPGGMSPLHIPLPFSIPASVPLGRPEQGRGPGPIAEFPGTGTPEQLATPGLLHEPAVGNPVPSRLLAAIVNELEFQRANRDDAFVEDQLMQTLNIADQRRALERLLAAQVQDAWPSSVGGPN